MHGRIADAIRRGKVVCEQLRRRPVRGRLLRPRATRPVDEVREMLGIPPKGPAALEAGSVGPFDLEGMSETQRRALAQRRGGTP